MMNLVKYNRPGNAFDLLGSFFNDFSYPVMPIQERRYAPLVDIYEKNDDFILEAQLPGVKKEDIEIEVENGKLSIKAKNVEKKEVKKENYYMKEIAKGDFVRSFYLPESVDKDALDASFKNGILNIKFPKLEKEKPKQIPIN